jgi:glucosamine--fructose-6-phosphate aminotransferase (isomerizing)
LVSDEFYIASDATPIVEYTKNVVYMEDEEIAFIERGKELKIKTIKNKSKTPYIQELELQLRSIGKRRLRPFHAKRNIRTTSFYQR